MAPPPPPPRRRRPPPPPPPPRRRRPPPPPPCRRRPPPPPPPLRRPPPPPPKRRLSFSDVDDNSSNSNNHCGNRSTSRSPSPIYNHHSTPPNFYSSRDNDNLTFHSDSEEYDELPARSSPLSGESKNQLKTIAAGLKARAGQKVSSASATKSWGYGWGIGNKKESLPKVGKSKQAGHSFVEPPKKEGQGQNIEDILRSEKRSEQPRLRSNDAGYTYPMPIHPPPHLAVQRSQHLYIVPPNETQRQQKKEPVQYRYYGEDMKLRSNAMAATGRAHRSSNRRKDRCDTGEMETKAILNEDLSPRPHPSSRQPPTYNDFGEDSRCVESESEKEQPFELEMKEREKDVRAKEDEAHKELEKAIRILNEAQKSELRMKRMEDDLNKKDADLMDSEQILLQRERILIEQEHDIQIRERNFAESESLCREKFKVAEEIEREAKHKAEEVNEAVADLTRREDALKERETKLVEETHKLEMIRQEADIIFNIANEKQNSASALEREMKKKGQEIRQREDELDRREEEMLRREREMQETIEITVVKGRSYAVPLKGLPVLVEEDDHDDDQPMIDTSQELDLRSRDSLQQTDQRQSYHSVSSMSSFSISSVGTTSTLARKTQWQTHQEELKQTSQPINAPVPLPYFPNSNSSITSAAKSKPSPRLWIPPTPGPSRPSYTNTSNNATPPPAGGTQPLVINRKTNMRVATKLGS